MQQEDLDILRARIDQVDQKILEILSVRFEIVSEIAHVKKGLILPTLQEDRKKQVIAKWKGNATALSLDPMFAEKLFELIHAESVRQQDMK